MPADAAHAGVDHGRVEDEAIVILVLVHGEHTAALVSVSGLCGEEREGTDGIPFPEELQELLWRGVHFCTRQRRPLIPGRPEDFRVKVSSAELAVVQIRERVEGRAQIPFDPRGINLADADSRSNSAAHRGRQGGLRLGAGAELV